MPKITLQDIAGVCDVDISTVSRAMRNDTRVKPETLQKIHETAKRLGYRPNLLARNLAGGRTRTIWFIVPSLDATVDCRTVRHASHCANEADYLLFAALHNCDDFGPMQRHNIWHYEQMIERLGQGLADGAIVLPRRHVSDSSILRKLVLQNFPLVFIDNYVTDLPVHAVTTDNESSTRELAKHCVKNGAEEAILLFQEPNPVAQIRRVAAQSAFSELNLPFTHADQMPASGIPKTGSTLAILGSSQYFLHQFITQHAEQLRNRELVFGVFDEWIGEPGPAKKVVIAVQDNETMARTAVKELISQIETQPDERSRLTTVPVLHYISVDGVF